MPRANLALASELLLRLRAHADVGDVSYRLPSRVSPSALQVLAQEVMHDDLAIYPHGEMLMWDVARHEGYNIPPYPLAGCGECVQFLADYGAADIPGWYELRGVGREVSGSFFAYGCVMARNRGFWRKLWAVPGTDLGDADRLAPWLVRALEFSLGNLTDADDPTLFRC